MDLSTAKPKHSVNLDDLPQQFKEFLRVKDPLNHLTDAQKGLMSQLRADVASWTLTDKEREYIDEMCLYRFLLGWKWNLKEASKHLKESMEFRARYKPDQINIKHIAQVYQQGWLFEHGYDKEGHPIIYMLLGRDKLPYDNDQYNEMRFKNICYVMEQCYKRMPPGIYSCTYVIDLKGANISINLIKKMKGMFLRMGDAYCESLYKGIVLNVGVTFLTMWNFLKPFLAKSTVAKYALAKSKSESKTLQQYIALEYIPKDLAGGIGKSTFVITEDFTDRFRIAAMQNFAAIQGDQEPAASITSDFAGEGDNNADDDAALAAAEAEAKAAAESLEETDE